MTSEGTDSCLPAQESTPPGKIAVRPVLTQVIRVLMRNRWDRWDKRDRIEKACGAGIVSRTVFFTVADLFLLRSFGIGAF